MKNSRDDCRRLAAWLSCIIRSGGRLTWDVFTPSVQHWQTFANDCVKQPRPVQSLSDYATLLTKFTAMLAEQIGPSHPQYTWITANSGKPWHAREFASISSNYKDARAAAKATAAAKLASGTTPAGQPPVIEHAALPVPVYMLESWLADAQSAMTAHIDLTEELAAVRASLTALIVPVAPALPPPRRQAAAKKQKVATNHHRTPAMAHRQAVIKNIETIEARIHAAGRLVGGYAVTFVQFIYMIRASSAAGGLELDGPGIADDLQLNAAGLTYIVRFMKGWKSSDSLHGERLPLTFRGAATVPWSSTFCERSSDSNASPERDVMLSVIRYAIDHKNPGANTALISIIDTQNPETEGSAIINGHLHRIDATGHLSDDDRLKNGRSQSISSHSIRKAAISMALASGVSAQNIRRWTRWHQAEMVWHYAQADYVVPDHWRSFFAWMTALPAQNA